MNGLLLLVLGVAIVLMLIGFGCGWYVRGAYVRRYMKSRLEDRPMRRVTVAGVHHEIKPGSVLTMMDVKPDDPDCKCPVCGYKAPCARKCEEIGRKRK